MSGPDIFGGLTTITAAVATLVDATKAGVSITWDTSYNYTAYGGTAVTEGKPQTFGFVVVDSCDGTIVYQQMNMPNDGGYGAGPNGYTALYPAGTNPTFLPGKTYDTQIVTTLYGVSGESVYNYINYSDTYRFTVPLPPVPVIRSFTAAYTSGTNIDFSFDISGAYTALYLSRDINGTIYSSTDYGVSSSPISYNILNNTLGPVANFSNPVFTLTIYNGSMVATANATMTGSYEYIAPLVAPSIFSTTQVNYTLQVVRGGDASGGRPPYTYAVYQSDTEDGTYTKVSSDVTTGTITTSSLAAGTSYIKLGVTDASGTVAYSSSNTTQILPIISPTGGQRTGTTTIDISWNNLPNGDITGYNIYLVGSDGAQYVVAVNTTTNPYAYDATDLATGTYTIRILTNGGPGTSEFKSPASTVSYTAPTFTVTYSNNTGSGSVTGSPFSVSLNGTHTVQSAGSLTKSGYTFTRWNTLANDSGTSYAPGASIPNIQANITLYAIWSPSDSGGAVCFLGNAPVLTPAGYRRIDSLAVGDMVRTADGRVVAIQRVKHQRVVAPSAAVNPFVIPKGTFGATENLAISPRHAVAVPGRGMVEARELGLRQMSMRAAFDYYNLELPEWDNMVVAGVEVESLAPKKRVVMTAAEFRGLVAAQGLVRSATDLAKLSRFVEMLEDGRVAVSMTQKARRM